MGKILVAGCASQDTIHLTNGTTVPTIGGAGLYTALAALKAGADVTLFAPRPRSMPDEFDSVARRLHWIGPFIELEQMPSLEIAHHGNGRATLIGASWGAEQLLTPREFAKCDTRGFDFIHIAALSSASRQHDFLEFFRECLPDSKISVGTYAQAIIDDIETVLRLLKIADLFFMNQNEANLLELRSDTRMQLLNFENFPDKAVFVTDGASGVTIINGEREERLPALEAIEIDPTGAGDTFCGTTLALISNGADLTTAALEAIQAAANVVQQPGPAGLFRGEGNS